MTPDIPQVAVEQPKTLNFRLQEIDFLRGLAILIVLFRHHWLVDPTFKAGWMGVDLFFVLSGFLVSGLLFSEYKKFGDIKPFQFLMRRGFKIYPMFYFSILVSLIIVLLFVNTDVYIWNIAGLNYRGIALKFIVELTFLQNYFFFSSFWGHHWSLAVEEHFYIMLVLLLFYLAKTRRLDNQKLFLAISIFIFAGCLVLRIASNVYFPDRVNFFETHLRIDSLFAGVFISYFYNFNAAAVNAFYKKFKYPILLAIIPLLAFTPFVDPIRISTLVDPAERFGLFLAKTIGLTGVYIAFGFLLIIFIEEKNINQIIKRFTGERIFNFVCMAGFYSYGIYLFHNYVAIYGAGHAYLVEIEKAGVTTLPIIAGFILYFFASISIGIIISHLIELPFLKLREKLVPKRKIQNG